MDEGFRFLATIAQPSDLKRFSRRELKEVANEVRQAILDNVSQTGGHFSSNLGTVELTVAMYAAYDIPPDTVVWDTGHQAYPHKILTGRLDRFPTLRQYGGLSGFLKRDESPFDAFGAGHAGTAISAAVGMALARNQLGGSEKVVAIAGDASIATGMSWEALNHAGAAELDVTVVLNDNRMSIAPNVGALTNYLAALRSQPRLQNAARKAKDLVSLLPDPVARMAAGLRHGITHYLAPQETGTIFEEIGWEYIGPVDGHDVEVLMEVFTNIKQLNYPVFVHALTTKGKGFAVAEEDARKWHGVVPFSVDAPTLPKSKSQTYTQVFGECMLDAAAEDQSVIAITAAMPDGTGLNAFAEQFPERFVDVGIAEPHAVTMAAGMAARGAKPCVAIYSTFLQRAYDQIAHDVALQHLPVRFFLDRAGLVGDDGPTHHGAMDLSYLAHIPGMVVLAPRDADELRLMTAWMLRYSEGPSAVRYPRGATPASLPELHAPMELGRSEVLRESEGSKATFAAIGSMVETAYLASEELARQGIATDVINLRFAAPLDFETVFRLGQRSGRVITVEENVRRGGVGEAFASRRPDGIRVDMVSLPDAFVTHGSVPQLKQNEGLTVESLVDLVTKPRLLAASS
jgi:1-deoxy-D-xylulose-5-phosphate synthase